MEGKAMTTTRTTRGRLDDGSANPVDIHVGNRMRLRRTLLGLSQQALSAALGMSFQQVQKYERGANRIGASRLFDLARVLDVPVSFFFDDMPDAVSNSSPARVVTGDAVSVVMPIDPLARREVLDLARDYMALPPYARHSIRNVIRAAREATAPTTLAAE